MNRELRDLHHKLAAAEQRARAAIDAENEEAAQEAMAEVHRLRAAILEAEARDRKEREAALSGVRVASNGVSPARLAHMGGVPVLAREDKLTDWAAATGRTTPGVTLEEQRHAFGEIVRALAVGDWRNVSPDVRAALSTTPDAAGGFTIPDELATFVLDLARANAVAIQAGVRTIPMTSKTLTIPKLEADPTGAWKAENELAPEDTTTAFGANVLTAKTWMVLVRMSLELLEDSALAAQAVERAIAAAGGLALDRAILVGSGVGEEPLGIANTPGILEIALGTGNGGPITDYSVFSQAVQRVAENNGKAAAVILHPRDMGAVDRLTDSTGQPLQPPASWQGLTKLTTSTLPTGLTVGTATNASIALLGDFSEVFLGLRLPLSIQVSREAGDVFQRGQVLIRARLRCDVAVARPNHMVKITGIVPA